MLYAAVDLSHLGKPTKEGSHLESALSLTHDIGLVSPVLFLHFSGNHIFKGRAAGIAVNENGKGLITGRWGCWSLASQVVGSASPSPPPLVLHLTDWPPASSG